MKFAEYLWYLTHRPLKLLSPEESDVYTLFKATGKILDKAKEKIFLIRRQALIATATGKALDKHGIGRKLKRFAGETDEQYRKRLLAKYENARMAGTYRGIVKTVISLGYDNAEVRPLYLEDAERWAEFYVFLDKELIDQLGNYEIVQKEVKKVKQASSLPVYVLTHYSQIKIRTKYIEGLSTQRKETGTLVCGGNEYIKNLGYKKKASLNISTSNITELSSLNKTSKSNKYILTGYLESKDLSVSKTNIEGLSKPLVCSKELKFRRVI